MYHLNIKVTLVSHATLETLMLVLIELMHTLHRVAIASGDLMELLVITSHTQEVHPLIADKNAQNIA